MIQTSTKTKLQTIAVLGNPNTGKSTLFNLLTGIRQQTGNYPGVTVEKRTGQMAVEGQLFELIDLPGTYSLAPRSPDEMVTVNVLLGKPPATQPPDVILCVVDASNMQRNLFLVSQILDLHQPTVVAVNMTDVARSNGIQVDLKQLSGLLGVPVVGVQANKRIGVEGLKQALAKAPNQNPSIEHDPFTEELQQQILRLQQACPDDCGLKRFVVTRMLFDIDGFMTGHLQDQVGEAVLKSLAGEQTNLGSSLGHSAAESESHARFNWIQNHLDTFVSVTPKQTASVTDRIDRWLTHPVLGLMVATVVLIALFQLVFWAAEPASTFIDGFNALLSGWVNAVIPPGALNSLLIDGLINGVGSVLIFLPQILLLFLVLAVLEDSGYMARAAYLMDKFLSRIGMSGVSLVPLLSSFACAIPGIMAARVIRNERERLITILIAPLMSCSARLPVYILLIVVFVPKTTVLGGWLGLQGLTMFAMYLVGIVTAIAVAWVLKKTILRTGTSSFVMELPTYKIPSLRNVWQRMFDGGWAFVRDAGTIIVVMTILVWAAAYFPRGESSLPTGLKNQRAVLAAKIAELDETVSGEETAKEEANEEAVPAIAPDEARVSLKQEMSDLENQIGAYQLRNSYLGRAGRLVEPVVKPLGWDWRIGSAVIASFPAREVVVATVGVIFGIGSDADEESDTLKESIAAATWEGTNKPLFTLPVALSVMVFFALCAQCVSTLAVIRRETNSYRWPIFTFVYMTVLAYFAALVTFQVANWIA